MYTTAMKIKNRSIADILPLWYDPNKQGGRTLSAKSKKAKPKRKAQKLARKKQRSK